MTREAADQFWEKGEAQPYLKDITLQRTVRKQKALNPGLNREVSIKFIETAGDMNRIYPNRLCEGSLVSASDSSGCVVSTGLAEKLYSSHQIIGEVLLCREKNYIVRGLIKTSEFVCMVQGEKNTKYSHLWISSQKISASEVMNMLSGMVSAEPKVKSEGDLYVGIAGILVMLPFLLLYILLMLGSRRWYRDRYWRPWIKDLWQLLFAVFFPAGIALILVLGLHFSDDYLPPSWSDLSFWGKLFSEKIGDIEMLWSSGLEYADSRIFLLLSGCLAGSLTGLAALVLAAVLYADKKAS